MYTPNTKANGYELNLFIPSDHFIQWLIYFSYALIFSTAIKVQYHGSLTNMVVSMYHIYVQ